MGGTLEKLCEDLEVSAVESYYEHVGKDGPKGKVLAVVKDYADCEDCPDFYSFGTHAYCNNPDIIEKAKPALEINESYQCELKFV